MLERLTVDDFVPFVGKRFDLVVDDARIEAELAWARTVGAAPPPGSSSRRTFSLALRTAPEVRLPQRIYGVVHPRLGRLDLFLVPIAPEGPGNLYEAVFN